MRKNPFAFRLFIATIIRKLRVFILRLQGYNIPYSTIIESSVKLDKLNKKGLHIGEHTLVASGTAILSHDHCKRVGLNEPYCCDTYIGKRCFIAINSIILPGVHIGDEVIIGAGSVVTKDVPSNSIAAGNPAKVIKLGIKMNSFAAIENWNEINGWIN